MVSLVDIIPQTRRVRINGGEVELRGLGLRHIADLFVRFPELRKLFVDGAPEMDMDLLIAGAPDAVAAIIATAAGQPEAEHTIADALPIDEIMDCLLAVRDLTMPNGPAPLLDRLTRLLGGTVDVGQFGRDQDTNMPPLPSS
jgi:hypothetical protein